MRKTIFMFEIIKNFNFPTQSNSAITIIRLENWPFLSITVVIRFNLKYLSTKPTTLDHKMLLYFFVLTYILTFP